MANIYDEYLECKECGCTTFVEKTTCRILKDAEKTERQESKTLSERFLENKKVTYICENCGSPINV